MPDDKPPMYDDPMRFFREYGLTKQVMEELKGRTSLTAQQWVNDLLEAYRPHAEVADLAQAKKAGKQTHKKAPMNARRKAILRYIAQKNPEATIKEIAAEARKVAMGQPGGPLQDPEFVQCLEAYPPDLTQTLDHPDGPIEDPEFARDLQEPLDDTIRKRIERALK